MDNSFPQQGSDTPQRRSLFRGRQFLGRIPEVLARLVQFTQLTEAERIDAGIRLKQVAEDDEADAGLYPDDARNE